VVGTAGDDDDRVAACRRNRDGSRRWIVGPSFKWLTCMAMAMAVGAVHEDPDRVKVCIVLYLTTLSVHSWGEQTFRQADPPGDQKTTTRFEEPAATG
jgi:hypothetical protein